MYVNAPTARSLTPLAAEHYVHLYELSHRLNQTLNLPMVLHAAITQVCQIPGIIASHITLIDSHTGALRWQNSHGQPRPHDTQIEAALDNGILAQVLRTSSQEVHVFQQQTTLASPLTAPTLIALPLHADRDTLGVLTIACASGNGYTLPDDLLIAAAETLARAIANADHHTRLTNNLTLDDQGRHHLIHDLRSPLMAVSASMEVMQQTLQLASIQSHALANIFHEALTAGQRSLHTVLELANNLLDAHKLQLGQYALDRQILPLEPICNNVIDTLSPLATERHIMLRCQITPRSLYVCGDDHFLNRLLINLISNAILHSPHGGQVTVSACAPTLSTVLLVVEDTGYGIPPIDRERIFEPFVQRAGHRQGSGLGLAISRDIVHAHNGRIWVEPAPECGSRFCVELPTGSN